MTIEERADAYVGHPEEIDEFTSETIKRCAYICGAKEQKVIDIDKACKWLKENIEGGVHPQSAYGFVDRFRKAMEE